MSKCPCLLSISLSLSPCIFVLFNVASASCSLCTLTLSGSYMFRCVMRCWMNGRSSFEGNYSHSYCYAMELRGAVAWLWIEAVMLGKALHFRLMLLTRICLLVYLSILSSGFHSEIIWHIEKTDIWWILKGLVGILLITHVPVSTRHN